MDWGGGGVTRVGWIRAVVRQKWCYLRRSRILFLSGKCTLQVDQSNPPNPLASHSVANCQCTPAPHHAYVSRGWWYTTPNPLLQSDAHLLRVEAAGEEVTCCRGAWDWLLGWPRGGRARLRTAGCRSVGRQSRGGSSRSRLIRFEFEVDVGRRSRRLNGSGSSSNWLGRR